MSARTVFFTGLMFSMTGLAQLAPTAPNSGLHQEASSAPQRVAADGAHPASEERIATPQGQDTSKEESGLRIVIVESGKVTNNIKSRTAREVIIQVEDTNRRPVSAASVSVFLPGQGPSGVFANDQTSFIANTGPDGRLRFTLRPNRVPGEFQIRLAASAGGKTGAAVLAQTNIVAAAAIGGISTAAIVAIVAGAAAAGVTVVAAGGGGGKQTVSQSPSIGIGIGAGVVVIGPPQ